MLNRRLFESLIPLAELESALADRASAFRDHVFPASALSMDAATGHLVTRNGTSMEHPIQDHALGLLAGRLQIPVPYLRRCPSGLRAENVNHWLRGLGEKPLLVRFDGAAVRAILTDRYTPVDNLVLIRALRQAVGMEEQEVTVRYEWTPTRFVCQVVHKKTTRLVRGEEYLGGINLTNSEVGCASVEVSALMFKVICTNGAVIENGEVHLRRVHRTKPDRLQGALREVLGNVPLVLPKLQDALVRSVEEDLHMTEDEFQAMFTGAGISIEAMESVAEHLATSGSRRTRHLLMDTVTAVANEERFSLQDREALQRLGGRLLLETGK